VGDAPSEYTEPATAELSEGMRFMAFCDHPKGRVKMAGSADESPRREEVERLIQALSLRDRERELIHPMKSRAIEHLLQLGEAAIEPLLDAFESADLEARGWILYLLGVLLDQRAVAPLSAYLNREDELLRREEEADPLLQLDGHVLRRLLQEGREELARRESTLS
jgi:HEAT repeat protein